MESTWQALTAGLDEHDLALLTRYREIASALPDTVERVHTTQVQYARTRIFTSAYVKSHWLEIGVELTRQAEHPRLRTTFPTSKRAVMHRITLREVDQIDAALEELIREAWETVGPGFR